MKRYIDGEAFFRSATSVLVIAIIILMILPLPAWVLDLGLAASFAIAIIIFAICFGVQKPVEFDLFPTILLIALTLRLAMNVASTKLIIGEGHTGVGSAGGVIEGFSNFVMSGNVAIGFVTFCVLMIVNFIVITKGAGRMAEVSARFALDGLPGKQLAIDADVASGAISHHEAAIRRRNDQRETTFFGSLDGVSKFVKGDAVAGLLIILLNLVVGSAVSIFVHEKEVAESIETIAILTVGDGLVTQIPAVIISVASGLLLAKASNVQEFESLKEIEANRRNAMWIGAVIMFVFSLVPGLPFLPFFVCTLVIVGATFITFENNANNLVSLDAEELKNDASTKKENALEVDDLRVEFSSRLAESMWSHEHELAGRISNIRKYIAEKYGLFLPEVRLKEADRLLGSKYEILIHGERAACGELDVNSVLVLTAGHSQNLPQGRNVLDPVFEAPAVWVPRVQSNSFESEKFTAVTPIEVLSTHLLEVCKRNLPEILTIRMLNNIIDQICDIEKTDKASENTKLVKSVIPEVITTTKLHRVLKLFLSEELPIKNLPAILENLPENGSKDLSPEAIYEKTRERMRFYITGQLLRERRELSVVQLSPEIDRSLIETLDHHVDGHSSLNLSPGLNDELVGKAKSVWSQNDRPEDLPVFVVARPFRYFLSSLLRSNGVYMPVVAFDEIDPKAKIKVVGQI